MKKVVILIVSTAIACVATSLFLTSRTQAQGCFSIVVGRDASSDGYVLVAHNEDDSPPVIVNHHRIPRKLYSPGEMMTLTAGGGLEQAAETWSYIWSEIPGLFFSDSFVNEWGVCITSDSCPSREDQPEFSDGGISKMLRQIVTQRAKTARQGVLLAGSLVERFGYDAPGRTYIICDPNEGWLFGVVHGKHWLAKRVPDDQVAIVANVYSIREVDLSDGENVLYAADIADYAVSRGWYYPGAGDPFDFAAIYADPEQLINPNNYARQWAGYRHITDSALPLGPDLPFSIVPEEKVDVASLKRILRDHYEGTPLDTADASSGSPHRAGVSTICDGRTQTSFIAQLRADRPADIGFVYWTCLASPCVSSYIPYHFGINAFPAGFALDGSAPNLTEFQNRVNEPFQSNSAEAFWTFSNLYHEIDAAYEDLFPSARSRFDRIERIALAEQDEVERIILGIYGVDRPAALRALTKYSVRQYAAAVRVMEAMEKEIEIHH
jgi:dipeptidase